MYSTLIIMCNIFEDQKLKFKVVKKKKNNGPFSHFQVDVNYSRQNFCILLHCKPLQKLFLRSHFKHKYYKLYYIYSVNYHIKCIIKESTWVTLASRQQGLMGNVRKNGMHHGPRRGGLCYCLSPLMCTNFRGTNYLPSCLLTNGGQGRASKTLGFVIFDVLLI